MKNSKRRSKSILVTVIAILVIFNSFIYAGNGDDPYNTPAYPNVGAGEQFNYSHDEMVSGEDQEVTVVNGELTANVQVTFLNGQKPTYERNEVVPLRFTVSSISGKGDGADGLGGIKDVLLWLYSSPADVVGSKLAQSHEVVGGALIDATQQDSFADLNDGESFTFDYNYTVPADAVSGSTYYIYFQLFDYGMFAWGPNEEYYPLGQWMHAETVNGSVPFIVVVPTPPNPNPPIVLPPEQTFTVTAVSDPAGVASFVGTGEGFENGSDYRVYYSILDDTYEFVGWADGKSAEGTIDNANVELVALFEKIEVPVIEEVIDEELPEEIVVDEVIPEDVILDEVVPEDVPVALPETGGVTAEAISLFGSALVVLGVALRRK